MTEKGHHLKGASREKPHPNGKDARKADSDENHARHEEKGLRESAMGGEHGSRGKDRW